MKNDQNDQPVQPLTVPDPAPNVHAILMVMTLPAWLAELAEE
jgi:hypothetical protein